MTRIRAEKDILREKPGQTGAYEVLYHKGDYIRESDAQALGLAQPKAKAVEAAPADKAKRGPRDSRKTASRDKALTKKKEEGDG